MANRTTLAVGLYSAGLMACWLPPEFVREETQLFDTAVKDRESTHPLPTTGTVFLAQ